MPAFLLSCDYNRDVDWLIYTDVAFGDAPPNVTFKQTTLAELSARASALFKTEINLRPRKLCDLKIAYGALFADDLKAYDFWTPSDLDIVWGNIRRFMTDELLAQHDILTSRRNRLSGHFTLFRNTEAMNRLYERIPDVAARMAIPTYEHLDERELTNYVGDQRVFWREEWAPSAAYQKALADDDQLWWRDGRTFRADGAEVMYIHFHKLKPTMDTINFGYGDRPRAFAISRRGILA
jgi:hypothetical protein